MVADWKADWVGAGIAQLLASRGHKVVLCVNGYAAVESLQQYVRDAHLAALARANVVVMPLVRLFGVDESAVYFQHVLTKEPVIVEETAGLVLAQGHVSDDALLRELTGDGLHPVGIGDCLAPRTVEEAVLEGLVAASAL